MPQTENKNNPCTKALTVVVHAYCFLKHSSNMWGSQPYHKHSFAKYHVCHVMASLNPKNQFNHTMLSRTSGFKSDILS